MVPPPAVAQKGKTCASPRVFDFTFGVDSAGPGTYTVDEDEYERQLDANDQLTSVSSAIGVAGPIEQRSEGRVLPLVAWEGWKTLYDWRICRARLFYEDGQAAEIRNVLAFAGVGVRYEHIWRNGPVASAAQDPVPVSPAPAPQVVATPEPTPEPRETTVLKPRLARVRIESAQQPIPPRIPAGCRSPRTVRYPGEYYAAYDGRAVLSGFKWSTPGWELLPTSISDDMSEKARVSWRVQLAKGYKVCSVTAFFARRPEGLKFGVRKEALSTKEGKHSVAYGSGQPLLDIQWVFGRR